MTEHVKTFEDEKDAMAEYRRLVAFGTYKHITMRYDADWGAYIVYAYQKGAKK